MALRGAEVGEGGYYFGWGDVENTDFGQISELCCIVLSLRNVLLKCLGHLLIGWGGGGSAEGSWNLNCLNIDIRIFH